MVKVTMSRIKVVFKEADEPHVTFILPVFQTPGLWIDEGAEPGSSHQRSASWGSADHLKEVLLSVLTRPVRRPNAVVAKDHLIGSLYVFFFLLLLSICQSALSIEISLGQFFST